MLNGKIDLFNLKNSLDLCTSGMLIEGMLSESRNKICFILLAAMLILSFSSLAFATDVSSVPISARCYDPQGGGGTFTCTSQINSSNDVRASLQFDVNHPAYVQPNFTFSLPAGAIVTSATLTLEHQQGAVNVITGTANIKANGSASYTNGVCTFSPLTTKNIDFTKVCDITSYITNSSQASLVQIYFNFTNTGGKQWERVDFTRINITYVIPANFTGNISLISPSNESVVSQYSTFAINGSYNMSCSGSAGTTCENVELFAEYCSGASCSNFTRITSTTSVFNVTTNSKSCGVMNPGDTCIGVLNNTFNTQAQAKSGTYTIRIRAQSINSSIISEPVVTISVPQSISLLKPPYQCFYNDTANVVSGDCLSQVNVSDDTRVNVAAATATPSWVQANWTYNLPSNAIIENATFLVEYQYTGAMTTNVSEKSNNSPSYTWNICSFTLAGNNVDYNNTCVFTPYINNSNGASLIGVYLNITRAGGKQTEKIDYMGINLTYRTPILITDSQAYSDEDNVTILGYSFPYNSTITLTVVGPNGSVAGYPKNVTSNGTGFLTDSFMLPVDINGTYTINATYASDSLIMAQRNISVSVAGPRITFVPPTPYQFQILRQDWIYVNTTMSKNAGAALLEWDGVNYTMNGSGKNWFLNLSVTSNDHIYRVWANSTSNGAWGVSETRYVTTDYTPPSISNLTATPSDSDVYTPVTISSIVTDANGVADVTYQITYPNSTMENYTASNYFNLYYYSGLFSGSQTYVYGSNFRRTDFKNVSQIADSYQACGYIEKFASTTQPLNAWVCNDYTSGNPNSTAGCNFAGSVTSNVSTGVDWRCVNISSQYVTSENASVVWTCPTCSATQPAILNVSQLDGVFEGNMSVPNNIYYRTDFNITGSASSFYVTARFMRTMNLGKNAILKFWILNPSQLAAWTPATAPKCQFDATLISMTIFQELTCSDASAHSGAGNYTVIFAMTKAQAGKYLTMQTDIPSSNLSFNSTTGTSWNTSAVDYDLTLFYSGAVRTDWQIAGSSPLNDSENHTFVSSNSGTSWTVAKDDINNTLEDTVSLYQRINEMNFSYVFTNTELEGYYNVTVFATDILGNLNSTESVQFHIYHSTNLAIWDDTDSAAKYIFDNVTFYANYSSAYTNDPVTGASCNISFNTPTGWTAPVAMAYNGSSKLYYYNRSFNFSGSYNFSVNCSKVHFLPQNATSTYYISTHGEFVTTDSATYRTCAIVFYKVWTYDVNDALVDSNLTINIYNTTPSLKNTTSSATGNGGTGIYLGNYTLSTSADLGKWLITAIADNLVKGTQNFFVGTSSTKWKIDIDFTPDSIVYLNGTSITMNFTVWTKEGVRQTGLLPGGISVFLDSTNVTSGLSASGEGYIYTYTAATGSHIMNVSSGNVTNIRGFNVR